MNLLIKAIDFVSKEEKEEERPVITILIERIL